MSNIDEQKEILPKEETDKDKSHTIPYFINVKKFYNDVIKSDYKWNYYKDKKLSVKDIEILNDAEKCYTFINEFIIKSEKAEIELFSGLEYLNINEPQRCCHIISTFFGGIALYFNEDLGIKSIIKENLIKFGAFKKHKNDEDQFDRQFSYIWFMITLFHDLGYVYEKGKKKSFLNEPIVRFNIRAVPDL